MYSHSLLGDAKQKLCRKALLASLQQRRALSSIGLRREDKSRWERRAPLTPEAVKKLIQETGTRVYVESSTKRIFSDKAYAEAGAIVTEDLSPADIILGIKEVPVSSLLPNKTYLFFSHTHKGNEKNMPMLKSILDKNIRLIDYELMKDSSTGKRLVAFGHFAGNAGMIDALHGLGHRFLGFGYSTPYMYQSMAHAYKNLDSAKASVATVGDMIANQGTPANFGPMVFAFTGKGNVTQGAMEIFKQLPHEFVPPEDLPSLLRDKSPKLHKVYGVHLNVSDYVEFKSGGPAQDYQDYLHNPHSYRSVFADKIAPYVTTVVTGAYWDDRYPRLMTNSELSRLQKSQEQGRIDRGRMMSLADIVCDVRGAFECLSHTTNIEDGFYYYDAVRNIEHKNNEAPGLQVMGIDILPAELPIESSSHFSNVIYPYVKELVYSDSSSNLSPVLSNATIAANGQLTKEHATLEKILPRTVNNNKTVLLLGSGMVAGPLVNRLCSRSDVRVVIASNALKEAESLAAGHERAQPIQADISNKQVLAQLVEKADVVVSLVPAFLHPIVAEACIAQRKHMVTASYVSPEMQRLDSSAKEANVLIINEVGLDPGIDHMSAMKIIDEARASGKKVRSFISWCGGLPAPEASNVPLGYKFSWSPRGVLTASGNEAIYWSQGQKTVIPGSDLLKRHFPVIKTPYYGYAFEGLANRNSLNYTSIYGLGDLKDMDTMFRGTLRYQGYSDLLYALKKLGFLDIERQLPEIRSWKHYISWVLTGDNADKSTDRLLKVATNKLGLDSDHPMAQKTVEALQFFLQDDNLSAPINGTNLPSIDIFSMLLAERLRYSPGERDMVVMHHEFTLHNEKTGLEENVTSTLVQYGDQDTTAMAKTVGLPAAIATELVLDGKIQERGVHRPTMRHVYEPILDQLADHGIHFLEKSRSCTNRPRDGYLPQPTGSGVWE